MKSPFILSHPCFDDCNITLLIFEWYLKETFWSISISVSCWVLRWLSLKISSLLFYSLCPLWTYSFVSYWILRLIAIDMISFLFRTSSIISSVGEFVQIWNINYLESSFVVFRQIKIDTTDYRIVFRLLISEYLTFALIIQNAKIRKWVQIEICFQKSWTVLSSIFSRNRIALWSKWIILFDWAFSRKKQTHSNNFYAFESILNFCTRWFSLSTT